MGPKKKTKNRPKLASESVSRISSYYYISNVKAGRVQ